MFQFTLKLPCNLRKRHAPYCTGLDIVKFWTERIKLISEDWNTMP